MGKLRKKAASLPPVRALRCVKWQRRSFRRMLPRPIVRAAEAASWVRQWLIVGLLKRRPDEAARALAAAGGGGDVAGDILWYGIAYGFTVSEYFCYGFAGKEKRERARYLSDRESLLLSCQLNDLNRMALFHDKARTYAAFGAYYGRDLLAPETADELTVFERFIRDHPVFIVKPRRGSCGRGVERIDAAACGKSAEELFDSLLRRGAVVLEEPIVQSVVMASLNPSSVNTVRVADFAQAGRVRLRYCFLRVGRAGSLTDNGASGGIMAAVDAATGEVVSDGIDETGARFEKHPDTGAPIRGTLLPDWAGLTSLCDTLALAEPSMRFVGWDAAHTDRGWIVVEGNAQSELIGVQSTLGRGIREDIFRFLKEEKISTGRYRF